MVVIVAVMYKYRSCAMSDEAPHCLYYYDEEEGPPSLRSSTVRIFRLLVGP